LSLYGTITRGIANGANELFALKKSKQWDCVRYGRVSEVKKGVLEGTTSKNRITASFELK
jgi:hypothetical protein